MRFVFARNAGRACAIFIARRLSKHGIATRRARDCPMPKIGVVQSVTISSLVLRSVRARSRPCARRVSVTGKNGSGFTRMAA